MHQVGYYPEIPSKCSVVFTQSSRCICQILTELLLYLQNFSKYCNIKFHQNPSSVSRAVPCGRKTGQAHDETVALRNFANAPKNNVEVFVPVINYSPPLTRMMEWTNSTTRILTKEPQMRSHSRSSRLYLQYPTQPVSYVTTKSFLLYPILIFTFYRIIIILHFNTNSVGLSHAVQKLQSVLTNHTFSSVKINLILPVIGLLTANCKFVTFRRLAPPMDIRSARRLNYKSQYPLASSQG